MNNGLPVLKKAIDKLHYNIDLTHVNYETFLKKHSKIEELNEYRVAKLKKYS